jgi:Arylsulfatase A and related enzymes
MRAIMIMYDSLNRNLLQPYGCDWTHTPNFKRLAQKTVRFDSCYVGSLPCMPARRELHTGRSNFLHRSWGPLEPFDDSMPEILKKNGIYTHLVSDHQHYWEDGGATYHGRYNSWEFSRGQEGDTWKAMLPIAMPEPTAFTKSEPPISITGSAKCYDRINRAFTKVEAAMPQAVTFANGMEFLQNNHKADNWFLQIETFDPHEPFFSPDAYKGLYPHEYNGKEADWPPYYPVQEDQITIQHVRYEYAALLSMCDNYLGKVLDFMDAHNMWQDTMLIVNTDHGFLLGEHSWWGKSVMPVYDEIGKTPLFVWDPRLKVKDVSRQSLVQTVDLAPTLLNFFGQNIPIDMEGKSLTPVITDDTPVREYAVYGFHGGHVNITDGKHTYMRGPVNAENGPIFEYTLMPTHMRARFSSEECKEITLVEPFGFTKGCPVMRIPAMNSYTNPFQFGNKLFDIKNDPEQRQTIDDLETELRFIHSIGMYFKQVEAPLEQYERLGIPAEEQMNREMLEAQREARVAFVNPGILADYDWETGAMYQFAALKRYNPDNDEKLNHGFTSFVEAHAQNRKVSSQLVMSFLEQVVPDSALEMIRYGFVMIGRSD